MHCDCDSHITTHYLLEQQKRPWDGALSHWASADCAISVLPRPHNVPYFPAGVSFSFHSSARFPPALVSLYRHRTAERISRGFNGTRSLLLLLTCIERAPTLNPRTRPNMNRTSVAVSLELLFCLRIYITSERRKQNYFCGFCSFTNGFIKIWLRIQFMSFSPF